ncbi:MAG: type II secretion system F family protein [Actinobacteria bacterium]|jgi:type IV pilus assembly protein PilC|nr:type II secretion system F family protein [Actinomycetota bacterium]
MAATATFQYAVRDRNGQVVTGKIEADSPAQVASKLKSMGYAPLKISAVQSGGLSTEISLPKIGSKVKLKELAIFARQFATMINSGLSMLRALSILEEQQPNKHFAGVIGEIRAEVEAGSALSTSMAKHPDIFNPLMINMIKAGEVGGFLDAVLVQVADNFEAEVKLRGKVKSAMTYPVAVLVMAVLLTIGMLLFVVPTFAKLFSDLGGTLPAPTQMLVNLSDFLKVAIVPLLVLTVVFAIVWTRVKNTDRVREFVDPLKLKMPVFGGLFQKIALARFCRNLGTMLHSGVPILQSLDIVADTSGNKVIAHAVRDIEESVRRGESLTTPLSQHKVFPSMVVQMLAVGEDTGALDSMLGKIADFYDQEVEATTEQMTALIEPLMIAVLGGIVGSMIIALYMPIFKIFDLIGGSG